MFSFLKNHPFAIKAFFEHTIVLTYAIEKEKIAHMIPESLRLDLLDNKWAFVAVAMVATKRLRPIFFPKIFGNSFYLIGYRIFTRYETSKGKNLRGLYILQTETDRQKMVWLGNLMTHYNYRLIDIKSEVKDGMISIKSKDSKIEIFGKYDIEGIELPKNSPFSEWKQARRFAGPLPFTFSFLGKIQKMLIVQGKREDWEPKPIDITSARIGFIDNHPILKEATLANAFIVQNIPYEWKKGELYSWKKT